MNFACIKTSALYVYIFFAFCLFSDQKMLSEDFSESISANINVEEILSHFLENEEYFIETELCRIMAQSGSDKWGETHNYAALYSKLFSPFKDKEFNIFELGIGTNYLDVPSSMGVHGKPGASLYSWSHFFPLAHIYGADVDTRILFEAPRICTFYCDQLSSSSIQNMYDSTNLSNVMFDVMIEDGLHEFSASYNFLTNSLRKLKKGGIYIIEDLTPESVERFDVILQQIKDIHNLKFIQLVNLPTKRNISSDNNILIIQK